MKHSLNQITNYIAEQHAKQRDHLIYKAAKQKAEAIIWQTPLNTENIENHRYRLTQKYKICDTIEEVNAYKKQSNHSTERFHYSEIPVYMHRIAENTENYTEFKHELTTLHPSI